MTIIYKILTFIISLAAILLTIGLVIIIPISLSFPPMWLPAFLLIAVVLYTWFSNKFQQRVLGRREVVAPKLRDWVRVNGFVAIGFTILNIPPIVALLRNPVAYIEATKEMLKNFKPGYEENFKTENVHIIGISMLVYMIVLLIHVLWTFALMKKNKEFFQDTSQ